MPWGIGTFSDGLISKLLNITATRKMNRHIFCKLMTMEQLGIIIDAVCTFDLPNDTCSKIIAQIFCLPVRSVSKELHADRETGR